MGLMVKPGITLEQKRQVLQEDAITFLGMGVKPSLASPSMIRWMEFAARDAVLPHLDKGQDCQRQVEMSYSLPSRNVRLRPGGCGGGGRVMAVEGRVAPALQVRGYLAGSEASG